MKRTGRVMLAWGLLLWSSGGQAIPPGQHPGLDGEPIDYPAFEGRVVETFDVDRYTYLRVETSGETIWAAAPGTALQVDDRVYLSGCAPMVGFRSARLQRTFELIYFCSSLTRPGGGSR